MKKTENVLGAVAKAIRLLSISIVLIATMSFASAEEITLKPSSGIGFQGIEPPSEEDHTLYISNIDGNWGPPTTMVEYDYYVTGLDSRFWDALSIKFDTGMYNPSEYTAILRFYVQKGDYWNTNWHHYIILEGYMDPTYEDVDYDWEPVISDPDVHSIGDTTGEWFEETLSSSYWTSDSFWVTLRMWNVRIDAVELLLIPNIFDHAPTATRIEPASEISIAVKDTITFRVRGEDPDKDVDKNLHMVQWFIDDDWIETDPADGTSEEVSFTYTFENRGTFSVKATVYDEKMEEDSVTWEVNVGTIPTVEKYLYAKHHGNVNLEKAAWIKAEILPSTEKGYNDLIIEIHPLESEKVPVSEFWWQIPHQSRDIFRPIECAVGEIKIGYEEDVSIITSQSSILYRYPREGKQYHVKDTKEEGSIELTRSIVKETIGHLAGIPGAGIIIDKILEWMKGSPIDISNSPQDKYLTDINEYDQYTVIWPRQGSKELSESGIRYPNYVQISIPLRFEEPNHRGDIHAYVKLLLEKRSKVSGVESRISGKRCLSDVEVTINMESKKLSDLTIETPEFPTEEKRIPGFETIFAIAGLLAVAYLVRRRK